jgi:hypothetical protein
MSAQVNECTERARQTILDRESCALVKPTQPGVHFLKKFITFSYVERFTPFPWRTSRIVSRRTPVAFSNLTLGKAGQLAKNLGTGHNPPIFVDLALELDLVIDRAPL